MKSIRPPTKTGCLASIPPLQPSREGGTSQSRAHRQYRYYSNHLPILLHNNDSIYTIDSPSFGSGFNSHREFSLSPLFDRLYSNLFVVFACDPDSPNPDECLYPVSRVDCPVPHASIALGGSGLEDDSGLDAFRLGGLLEALPVPADVLITRCGVQNSAFSDVALILFTRCPRVASQEGRFA